MELEHIRALLRAKRKVHPELSGQLTLVGLRRLLARERIGWIVRPMPRPAQLVPYLDSWTIMIDSRKAESQQRQLGAHELGHLWLHHDPFFDRRETLVYNHSGSWTAENVEEDDAETFASMVLAGPRFWDFDPRKVPVRRRSAGPPPIPLSVQLEIGEREAPVLIRPLDARTLVQRECVEIGSSIDEWFFVEPDGRSWRIYDVAVAGSRKEVLTLCDPRAIARVFVPAFGRRRVYRFKARERREMTSDVVARQWAEAAVLSTRSRR